MPITIVLADDHPLLLNGTKEYLEKKWYKVVATATDGNEAYNKIIALQPDVAILDFDMPKQNGLEIAQAIYKNHISTKIIILSLHKQESIVSKVGKTIHAYLTKDAAMEELDICLKTILKEKTYIGSNLKNNIHFDANNNTPIQSLSVAEIKILKHVNKNLSSSQIAEELFISKRTVEKHRSNIIKKLQLDTSNQNALFIWLKNHSDLFNT